MIAEVVNIKRNTATVPWSEVEPLFNQAIQATNSTAKEVLNTIGYDSGSSRAKWQATGQAPTRVKYALIGLLSELHVPAERRVEKQFTFDELTGIFAALQGWPLPDDIRKQLTKKVANAL